MLVASSACSPTWSPDGMKLLYFSDDVPCNADRGGLLGEPGYQRLYRIDADGSDRRLLADGSFGGAARSPDGRQLAVSTNCDVRHAGDWFCSVALMDPDGTRTRLVENSYGGWVEWVAGGKEVLWPDFPALYRTDVSSGRTRSILPRTYKSDAPLGISRDGKRLAVARLVWRNTYWALRSPRIIAISGQLLQRITVPKGWRYDEISVHVP